MASTLGVVAAGVALFEVALIPGIIVGGAAALAPTYLPKLGRRLKPLFNTTIRRQTPPESPQRKHAQVKVSPTVPTSFPVKQAVAKTITFRIVVTSLDFTTNYVVLGELATAAGLSSFALVAGPLFYFAHEQRGITWDRPSAGKAAHGEPLSTFRFRRSRGLTQWRRQPVGDGSPSIGHWPRPSPFEPSPR